MKPKEDAVAILHRRYITTPERARALTRERGSLEFNLRVADHLVLERARQNMSGRALAEKAGVVPSTISRAERGLGLPSFFGAWRIARALGVSLDSLCYELNDAEKLRVPFVRGLRSFSKKKGE